MIHLLCYIRLIYINEKYHKYYVTYKCMYLQACAYIYTQFSSELLTYKYK